ncbi:MAG: hypothetical protein ACRCYT_02220, partial [Cetobacterium sp.]
GLENIDDQEMTEEESEEYDEFKKIKNKFTRYNLNTLNFTPLSESLKKEFSNEKDEFKRLENLGGVTAIEYYIKRHISRYYLVHKMNFALNKVLSDIKRELTIISLSFENSNNIIENMRVQEKKKSVNIESIRSFLENYNKESYEKKISAAYRISLFLPIKEYMNNLNQKISKQISEVEARNIYDDVEEFITLKYDLFEVELKSIFIEVKKELEEEVIKKLKKYTDNFNQKNIFDGFLLDLKLELELDEINKTEIKNKSEIKFKISELDTWISLFTTKYSSEVVLGEVRNLTDRLVQNHQKNTEQIFVKNVCLLKENFQQVVDSIFEKISKSIENLEEKRNKLGDLKSIQIILENLLEKTEDLNLLDELKNISSKKENLKVEPISFMDNLLKENLKKIEIKEKPLSNKSDLESLSILELEESKSSIKSFASKLKIKDLTEKMTIPNLNEIENSLKNIIVETQKKVDDCGKIEVTKSLNKLKDKFLKK